MALQKITEPLALDSTAQRIATALENRNSSIGSISALETTDKTSIVGAVNEVNESATDSAEKVYILIMNGNWRTGLRFKNLGSSFTSDQQAALVAGDFTEFWNGDYWNINGVNWIIVDNTQFQKSRGDTQFTSNHLIVMPGTNLIAGQAYLIDGGSSSSNTDTHGYGNCGYRMDEVSGKGRTQCKTIIANAFGSSHIASHGEYMTATRGTGGALSGGWYDADVELPSEVNIYGHSAFGTYVFDSSDKPGFNIGSQWGRFKLFELAPYMAVNQSQGYWLRDIVSASRFAFVSNYGYASYAAPSGTSYGLRPYFILV